MPFNKGGIRIIIVLVFFGVLLLSFVVASVVRSTNTVNFCASCHEMRVFYETWNVSPHGKAEKGVIKAKCADCHLPQKDVLTYLTAKAFYGVNDIGAHFVKKKVDWIAKWEGREEHVHEAYESGCKKCHKDLIAPGIPIKAFLAHRAYELGETRKTCISCHKHVGHGDLVYAIRSRMKI